MSGMPCSRLRSACGTEASDSGRPRRRGLLAARRRRRQGLRRPAGAAAAAHPGLEDGAREQGPEAERRTARALAALAGTISAFAAAAAAQTRDELSEQLTRACRGGGRGRAADLRHRDAGVEQRDRGGAPPASGARRPPRCSRPGTAGLRPGALGDRPGVSSASAAAQRRDVRLVEAIGARSPPWRGCPGEDERRQAAAAGRRPQRDRHGSSRRRRVSCSASTRRAHASTRRSCSSPARRSRYTDGLVERRGESIDDGLTRLREAAEEYAGLGPNQLSDALRTRMAPHPDDDLAMLTVRVVDTV